MPQKAFGEMKEINIAFIASAGQTADQLCTGLDMIFAEHPNAMVTLFYTDILAPHQVSCKQGLFDAECKEKAKHQLQSWKDKNLKRIQDKIARDYADRAEFVFCSDYIAALPEGEESKAKAKAQDRWGEMRGYYLANKKYYLRLWGGKKQKVKDPDFIPYDADDNKSKMRDYAFRHYVEAESMLNILLCEPECIPNFRGHQPICKPPYHVQYYMGTINPGMARFRREYEIDGRSIAERQPINPTKIFNNLQIEPAQLCAVVEPVASQNSSMSKESDGKNVPGDKTQDFNDDGGIMAAQGSKDIGLNAKADAADEADEVKEGDDAPDVVSSMSQGGGVRGGFLSDPNEREQFFDLLDKAMESRGDVFAGRLAIAVVKASTVSALVSSPSPALASVQSPGQQHRQQFRGRFSKVSGKLGLGPKRTDSDTTEQARRAALVKEVKSAGKPAPSRSASGTPVVSPTPSEDSSPDPKNKDEGRFAKAIKLKGEDDLAAKPTGVPVPPASASPSSPFVSPVASFSPRSMVQLTPTGGSRFSPLPTAEVPVSAPLPEDLFPSRDDNTSGPVVSVAGGSLEGPRRAPAPL